MPVYSHFLTAFLLFCFWSCYTNEEHNHKNLDVPDFPNAKISVAEFQATYALNPQMHIDSAESILGVSGRIFGADAIGKYYEFKDQNGILFYLIVDDTLIRGTMY